MPKTRPVYIEIISKSKLHKDEFVPGLFEVISSSGQVYLSNSDSMDYNCYGYDKCVISGYINTDEPVVNLELNAIHLIVPKTTKDLVIRKKPGNHDELSYDNEILTPVTVRIMDHNETAVIHINTPPVDQK